ncbi:MAG: hypothetical protein IJ506_03825 [Clostridia bacterium]|nr:hypothetical protein [Clostridia bacterium]
MNKNGKKLLHLALAATLATTALMSACSPIGGQTQSDGDIGDKKRITVSVYNGGTGTQWIEDMAKVWNQTSENYHITIRPEKIDYLLTELQTTPTADAYYTADASYFSAVKGGLLEDLSDILSLKMDGDTKTIGEKFEAVPDWYNDWKQIATNSGQGMYLLPYADMFNGISFDYDLFRERGWLISADKNDSQVIADLAAQGVQCNVSGTEILCTGYTGDLDYFYYDINEPIMSAGKDGLYGTYDDGQPTTEEEWNRMLANISATAKVFLWSGMYDSYVNLTFEAVMAQYSGMDAFDAWITFDSNGKEVTMSDGTKKVITIDNGYEVYGLDGYKRAFEFMKKYFNNSLYNHPKCISNITHLEAQNLYLLGFYEQADNPLTAMLVDGAWWENEARAMFEALKESGETDRGYGKRDYRYMLLPKLEGQKGIDDAGNGSVLAVQNSGTVMVPKMEDKEKLAAVKEFIAYTMSDENLRKFTVQTGVINPYYYELTEADREAMTPLANATWDIYHDTENIGLVRPTLLQATVPVRFLDTTSTVKELPFYAGNASYGGIMKALYSNKSIDDFVKGAKNYISVNVWKDLVASARAEGFYANGD